MATPASRTAYGITISRFATATLAATLLAEATVSAPPRLAEGTAMIELVFVACLATAADTCTKRSLLRLPDGGLSSCMTTAQAQLAQWSETHPGHRVVRWSCRMTGGSDREA
jgi:hypothetical protein